MIKVGFIGAGNMGGALAKAAAKVQCQLLISDHDPKKAEILSEEINGQAVTNNEIAKTAKYIFLGVKPQVLPDVLAELSPIFAKRDDRFILVTMAAGITTDSVKKMSGGNYPVIRIMPNTPAMIGKGMILYCCNDQVTNEETIEFLKLIENAGLAENLDEGLIDAGCAVSGCGPAFVYMFIEALAEGGVKSGLPKEKALRFAAQTVLGAGEMVLKTGKSPEELKNAVCSPNGSTIEGVHHLEATDFKKEIHDTVAASFKRTVELGLGK